MVTLKYRDERDRAFGLGGMAVCMGVMESERYIDNISLDAETDHGIRFTPGFSSSVGHNADEGKNLCSLEDDEIRELYVKTFNYFNRLFFNSEVCRVINSIVDNLEKKRTIGNEEIVALLRPFSRWC